MNITGVDFAYIPTADIDRVEFIADTIDSGVCHMAFFKDPDGNELLLHHRYAPRR
jgi:hypothetical protein